MGRHPQMRRRSLTAGPIADVADAVGAAREPAEPGRIAGEARAQLNGASRCPPLHAAVWGRQRNRTRRSTAAEMPSALIVEFPRQRLQADAQRSFADGTRFLQTVRLPGQRVQSAEHSLLLHPDRVAHFEQATGLPLVRSYDSGERNSPYSRLFSTGKATSVRPRPRPRRIAPRRARPDATPPRAHDDASTPAVSNSTVNRCISLANRHWSKRSQKTKTPDPRVPCEEEARKRSFNLADWAYVTLISPI